MERIEERVQYLILFFIILFVMSFISYNNIQTKLRTIEEEMADLKNKMEIIEGYPSDHSEIK